MRLILLLFLFTTTTYLSAQYEKGNWWFNASSGFTWESMPYANGDLLSPNVEGGVFLGDRWLVGAGVSRPAFNPQSLISTTSVTPFIRRYFPSTSSPRLHYYAELGLGLSFNQDGLLPQAALGLEYQLSPGVMINAEISGGLSTDDDFGRIPSAVGLQLGTSVLFGGAINRPKEEGYFLNKGDFLLDGSFANLTFGRRNGDNILSGNIRLNAGYMLTNQLMLEGAAGVQLNDFSEGSFGTFTFRDNSGFVSLGLRQYFNPGGRFQPYVAGAVRYDFWGYNFMWNDIVIGREDIDFEVGGLSVEGKAGFLYFLKENVALDFNLGYRNTFTGDATRQGGQIIGSIGMKLFFGGKKKKRAVLR